MKPPLKHIMILRWLPKNGEWGGMEKLLLEWLERIDYAQARLSLAVMPDWKQKFTQEINLRKLPVEVIAFPFEFTQKETLRFRYFYSFFKKLKPNTIIFMQGLYNEFHLPDIIAAWLIAPAKVFMHENLAAPEPAEKTSRTYLGFIKGPALWWYAKRTSINTRAHFCHSILVVSDAIKKNLTDKWGYAPGKVKITYHGVLTDQFSPSPSVRAEMRQKFNIETNTPVILVTARLSAQKRIDRLIEAFMRLGPTFNKARVFILGQGPQEAQLKKLVQDLNLNQNITFLGHVQDLANYLQMADLYVLPSDNEGLSIALMEAMATGLICISTDCPGSNEVIVHQQNGFLVDKSVEGVYRGLIEALSLSPQRAQEMSQKARLTIKERFDININTKKTFNLMGVPSYGI